MVRTPRAPDRVSVKPHASPVLHAINYLLGRLDAGYLLAAARVRRPADLPDAHQGPRPGRLLDRLGRHRRHGDDLGRARPPLRRRPLRRAARGGRQIALLGDAELDEGAVWEAVADPIVARLGEVLWVVDLNRQSLDRVVPDIAAGRLRAMFEAAGWHAETVKYGRRLHALFERDGGEALRGADRRA